VPIAASNSDIGLPDFHDIKAVIKKEQPKIARNKVGSTTVLQMKEKIREKSMVRLDHLVKNFNMNIAAVHTATFNHNNPE